MEELTWAQALANLSDLAPEIWQASLETGLMLGIGLTAAILLGGPLGVLLYLTQPGQLFAHRTVNGVLGWLVNLVRSFPFIILMVSLVPLTRVLVGSTIGPIAAAVPLSFAAIPYFARLVEQTLREIPRGVVEAAEAMGASPAQIIVKVLINEARAELARDPVVWWSVSAAFILMFVLVLAANLFSDRVRDAFDPRSVHGRV